MQIGKQNNTQQQRPQQQISQQQRNNDITSEELSRASNIVQNLMSYFKSKVVGQDILGYSFIVAMITNGHILLESVPGLAKTTAAKVMTDAVKGKFSRIQCTPDLLPSDIIGTQTYNAQTNQFENKVGPVYANFVLLDELNRSSAKTQSAMLEAMQEHAITIGGKTYNLPDVFVVIATQNPVEQEGTYELAEAQLDRFLLKVKLDYPDTNDEVEILNRIEKNVFSNIQAVSSLENIKFMQSLAKRVYMDNALKKYIVDIVQASRHTDKVLNPQLAQYVHMGASTRAAISFMDVAKAVALINGRTYCTPEDIRFMRHQILGHRIMLNFAAMADGIKEETIIDAIIGVVGTP